MKIHWAAILVCMTATSCVIDTGTQSGAGGNDPGGNGPDAGLPEGDALPAGAVSFFYRLACPFDWTAHQDAAGRVIVGANVGLPRGTLIGKPLSSGEDRVHTHTLSADVTIAAAAITAPETGTGVLTHPMTYTLTGTTDPVAADVPYRQLLVCKKRGAPKINASPLPPKLHMYFDLDACPAGWKPATATAGRILVGLAPQVPADMPFGGDPMTSPEPRTHSHGFSSTLVAPPHAVTAFDGGMGMFGKTGSYPIDGESDPAAIDIPMISLLHCEKQ